MKTPEGLTRLWVHETSRVRSGIRFLAFLSSQVYRDKLSDSKDLDAFDKAQKDSLRKKFEEMNETEIMIEPLIFCHFAKLVFLQLFLHFGSSYLLKSFIILSPFVLCLTILQLLLLLRGIAEAKYMPVPSWDSLNTLLNEALKVISTLFQTISSLLHRDITS